MRRRAERMFLVRAFGYGAIALSLIATGAAGLSDNNTVGVTALVAGGMVGAMAGLFGYVAVDVRRKPFRLRPSWTRTPSVSRFGRVRLVTLGISSSILGIAGLGGIVLGLIELFLGRQFAELIGVGIFLLAVGAMAGTTAWARWPRAEPNNPW